MKILLIDDEQDICVILKFMLEKAGHQVISFTSPVEAKIYIEKNKFDIVVSDFQMAPITGLSLFRWLRENNHQQPFILLTGEPFMDQDQLQKEGIHHVLFKPHGLDDIIDVLRQLN